MNNTTLKSIGAILAGFITGAVLSIGADFLMEKLGVMSAENFKQTSSSILSVVIAYRFIFNVIGCYITARLAPNKPMKHVIIIGIIGTVLSIIGTLAMWDMAIPFYNIIIILMSFPSAWFGGQLFLKIHSNDKANESE